MPEHGVAPCPFLLWLEILRDELFQAGMAELSYLNSSSSNVPISSVSSSVYRFVPVFTRAIHPQIYSGNIILHQAFCV